MATGYPATVPGEEAAPLRRGAAKARGDERVRRVWWDEPATHGKVLYPSQARQVYPALACRKPSGLPREIHHASGNGLSDPQGEPIA